MQREPVGIGQVRASFNHDRLAASPIDVEAKAVGLYAETSIRGLYLRGPQRGRHVTKRRTPTIHPRQVIDGQIVPQERKVNGKRSVPSTVDSCEAILVKKGNRVDLVEVKAKSYDPVEDGNSVGARGGIMSEWKPYLLDAAFQKYVVAQAFPQWTLHASLMLADKTVLCPTNGLNQKFKIVNGPDGRKHTVLTTPLTAVELSQKILCVVNVD